TSPLSARIQPWEIATPTGPVVPWMAIRFPPSHPEGRSGWVAVVASAQQPYAGFKLPRNMSVMANRPVGGGEGAAPTVTVNERTRRLPRRSLAVLEERSTSIEYRVQPARNRDGSSLTQPSFPSGSSGVETPAHPPRWAKTAKTVGDPNSVRQP